MGITELHPKLRRPTHQWRAAPITCMDGFSFSVQASEFHYCKPCDNEGPHTHFEVGYPSQNEPLLLPYSEEPDSYTDIYGYVPAEAIDAIIEKHGGIDETQ